MTRFQSILEYINFNGILEKNNLKKYVKLKQIQNQKYLLRKMMLKIKEI